MWVYQVSVCTCFLKARLSQDLVCVLSSVVVGRLRGGYVGPPTAFPVRAPVYRACPCRDPPVSHKVQGDSVAKRANPSCVFVGVVGVVKSCVPCARVRGRTSRSCATDLHLLDWKRCSSSQSSPFSVFRIIFHQNFCGLWVLSPTRHLVRHVLHIVRDLIEIFLLVVCSVAMRLVHVNANLFLSR